MLRVQRKIRDYLTALLACSLAFAIYRFAAAPFLEPPETPEIAYEAELPEAPADPELQRFFPPDSWQLRAPRQLASQAGTLIFEKLTQLDGKTWKLEPVTLLVRGRDRKRPLLIEAPKAEIEFAGSLDALGNHDSPITAGQLLGNVHIYSPPSAPGANDQLIAEASNVWINHREIKTTESVRMKLGDTEAVGRDFTIHLSGKTGKADGPQLDRVELIYLDHLSMPLPEGGLWEPLPGAPRTTSGTDLATEAKLSAPGAKPPGLLRVDCQGRLTYSFETFLLELVGREVNLRHQVYGYMPDTIRCERLSLRLHDPDARPTNKPKWATFVRRIEARGSPVIIDAPTVLASGRANHMIIDFEHGPNETSLEMYGEQAVQLGHRGISLQVPHALTYRFPQADVPRLGTLLTDGGGTLTVDPGSGMPLRELQWQGKLQLLPDDQVPDQEKLWIDGGFTAFTHDQGTIRGDTLYFQFLQSYQPAGDGKDGQKLTIVPRFLRLSMTPTEYAGRDPRRVVIDLPQGYFAQERINIDFKHIDPSEIPADQEPVLSLNRATGSQNGPRVNEPNGRPPSPNDTTPRPRVLSEWLDAEVTLAGDRIVAYDLSAQKQVRIEHQMEYGGAMHPVAVQSDDLRIIESAKDSRFQVRGQPARIQFADGFAEGSTIGINAAEDLIWIDREGEIRVPTPFLAGQQDRNQPSSWAWTLPPQIRFRGRMVLRERIMDAVAVQIHGSGQSRNDSAIWQFTAQSDSLRMTLTSPLNLRQQRTGKTPPPAEVQQISLLGAVAVDASGWEGELRKSRHRLETTRLNFEPMTSTITGEPGNYRLWSLRENTEANAPNDFLGNAPLLASHLIYHQQMRGDLQRRRLDFIRAVRLGIGPAQTWEQSLDVSKIEVPTMGQAILDCDQLSVFSSPQIAGTSAPRLNGAPLPYEVEGLGGVAFRGLSQKGLFSGTCNRFNYATSKDLLIMEGQNTAPVVFVRQLPGGTKNDVLSAYSLSVRPREMEIVDVQLQGANFGNLPPEYGVPPAAQADPASRRRNF